MATNESQANQVRVVLVPFLAHGHIIPLLDVARLLSSRGVKATFVTTPANIPVLSESDNIELEIIRFPSEEVGLPAGLENIDQPITMDHRIKFFEALKLMVEGQLEQLLRERRPSCVVSDMFLPWTALVASGAGIPWVAFSVGGYFALSVMDFLRRKHSQWEVESEDDEFVVAELPGELRLTRRILPPVWRVKEEEKTTPFLKLSDWAFEVAADKSFGVIVNSFHELEADYASHYQMASKSRHFWSLGPVSLCCRNTEQKANRGKEAKVEDCLRWLDSKPENSVIYVCFGSVVNMSSGQLNETAKALEDSGQNFMWVLRGAEKDVEASPKGFIISGWAPQLMILGHKATGGFLTHCGWNSTLEGVAAGVPMVTWPANFYDHSLNEKLITEVLKVGVSVGAKQSCDWMVPQPSVGREAIEAAVRRVMVGEEAEEMRKRASELKKMAFKAVHNGGSSNNDLGHFVTTFTPIV